jgi:hypothetical protein
MTLPAYFIKSGKGRAQKLLGIMSENNIHDLIQQKQKTSTRIYIYKPKFK